MAVPAPITTAPNFNNTAAPFAPLGRPVGGAGTSSSLEESLGTTFAPVTELEETAPTNLRQRRDGDIRDEGGAAPGSREARQEQAAQRREQEEIRRLAQRDQEVRAHEQAHASVGGRFAGAASFTFTRGPDGVLYATGGEVPIDSSPVPGDPEATLRKMQVVQRAALAPVDPSPTDRRIAAQAAQQSVEARADITAQRAEEAAARREEFAAEREQAAAERAGPAGEDDRRPRSFADRLVEIGATEPVSTAPRRGVFVDTAI